MIAKITMVLAFAAIAIIIGILCQKHAGSVTGFILGGRNVGPWLSAFAFGTSYFSAVIFVRLRRSIRMEIQACRPRG